MKWRYFALLALFLFLASAVYALGAYQSAYNRFETDVSADGRAQICHWFYDGGMRVYARQHEDEPTCNDEVRIHLDGIPISDAGGKNTWYVSEIDDVFLEIDTAGEHCLRFDVGPKDPCSDRIGVTPWSLEGALGSEFQAKILGAMAALVLCVSLIGHLRSTRRN